MEFSRATLEAVEKFRQAQAAFLSQPDTATDAEFRQAEGEFKRAAITVAQYLLAAVDSQLMSVQREPATPKEDLILWPQPDGTSRIIEAGDIRALVGYTAQIQP